MTPSRDITRLLEIMAALRTPETGCPWDLQQTFKTIAPYTIEEAHEVADAIERGNVDDLKDELGDLLLQVAFHARMAQEQKSFEFGDVVQAITEKLIRRHPHVFGDQKNLSPSQVKDLWHDIKAQEKAARKSESGKSTLSGIPSGLPALMRAFKLQQKAGAVGFDWNDPLAVLAKIKEEIGEIENAIAAGDKDEVRGEIGDLLFAVVNLARHFDVEPEGALRSTNVKFERRFGSIEAALSAKGKRPQDATLDEMDELWNAAKTAERA
jgi:ATP diphosphatase